MKRAVKKIAGEPTNKQIFSAIVDLHHATGKGFERVDKKLHDISEELIGIHKEFGEVHKEFDGVNLRLDQIEGILLRDHEQRIGAIEHKVGIGK